MNREMPLLPWPRQAAPLDASPESALGAAMAEYVRRVLQDELERRLATAQAEPRSPWMTPPAASRATGVPVKSIRAWVRSGRLTSRIRNRSLDPKQQKYLVNLDDVAACAEQAGTAGDSVAAVDRARVRAQEILAARAAKER